MQLISFNLCPFVQRASIVAHAKDIELERKYIDILNKPDWFIALSPTGSVPVLEVEGEVLFESTVIAEYLDDLKWPTLHPADALQRAKNKAWIEYGSSLLFLQFHMSIAKSKLEAENHRVKLREKLTLLEKVLEKGPFFNGNEFALIDAAYAPLFMRLDMLEAIKPLKVLEGFPGCQAWSEVILSHPAVKASEIENYQDVLKEFLAKKESWML